ncbi:MAG: DUF2064 domain-containing protein [Vicinamibacterales bacterium]
MLFTRAPRAEARAKHLPVEPAAAMLAAFILGWRETAAAVGAELMFVSPPSSMGPLGRLLPEATGIAQTGPTFGARIAAAIDAGFAHGAASVLLVGGDTPPLPPAVVEAAFDSAEASRDHLVVAPAPDGGVAALGFGRPPDRQLFHLPWCTPRLRRQLEDAALHLGLEVVHVAGAPDLDGDTHLAGLAMWLRAVRQSGQESLARVVRDLLAALRHVPRLAATVVPAAVRATARASRAPPLPA